MLPALVVARVPSGCFPRFLEALKAHWILEGEAVALVAQPPAVIPVLCKGSNEKEEGARFLPFLWYGSGMFLGGASL